MDRFSRLSVELLNAGGIEPGLIADHWIVRGTNTGPGADGSEPTGRTVSFQGAYYSARRREDSLGSNLF